MEVIFKKILDLILVSAVWVPTYDIQQYDTNTFIFPNIRLGLNVEGNRIKRGILGVIES